MQRGCWRKKKRSCGSDKSAHDLGRDKLKNASILRKYGSICMDEKTKAFIRIIYSTVNVVTFIPFFVFS